MKDSRKLRIFVGPALLGFIAGSFASLLVAQDTRKVTSLDGAGWVLYGFKPGMGEQLGIQQHPVAEARGVPTSVPNDVQTALGLRSPYGQGPELAELPNKEWWYTRVFSSPAIQSDQAALLMFSGIDYFADVWLNGVKLGSHEGAYTHFSFDITDRLRTGHENYLAIRVRAPWKLPGRSHYEFMKGEYDEWWDALPGTGEIVWPLGLHRSVRIEVSGQTRIDALEVWTQAISQNAASIKCKIDFKSYPHRISPVNELKLAVTIRPENFSGTSSTISERSISLTTGKDKGDGVELSAEIPNPKLWYTWDLGPQNLYVAEAALTDATGKVIDRQTSVFGIRLIERDEHLLYRLNGKPLFLKGAWYPMARLYPASADAWTYEKDLRMARHANMNHLINYTVVEKDEFYDLADRLGILLFMELPFNQEGPIDAVNPNYSRRNEFLSWSAKETGQIVRTLGNHPSIAVWAPVSEVTVNGVFKVDWDPRVGDAAEGYGLFLKKIHEVIAENDKDALFFPSYCDFGEHHFWAGGLGPETYDLHFDAKASLVSEYGALAFYSLEDLTRLTDAARVDDASAPPWPPLAAPLSVTKLSNIHGYQYSGIEFLTRAISETIERRILALHDYANDSQLYQAFLYGYAGDAYRRKLFAPINGIRSWMFKSFPEMPVSGFGVIDCFDTPSMAFYAQKRTFAPVALSYAIRNPMESVPTASPWQVPVWLSNVSASGLHGVTIESSLLDLSGKELKTASVTVDVPSSRAINPATLDWTTPAEPGLYLLRGSARSQGRVIATASQFVKVAPRATRKDVRVLVVGTPEWGRPVAEYLTALGARVTPVIYVPTVVSKPLNPFPSSSDELRQNYDVIWLAGFDNYWREAPEEWTNIIAIAVKSGVTFVHSGGYGSFHGGGELTAALDLTNLSSLLPVSVQHANDIVPANANSPPAGIRPTQSAPAWLKDGHVEELTVDRYHVLNARGGTTILIEVNGKPLLVSGRFGSGKTYAYLGFSPEVEKGHNESPIVLDRQIRAGNEGKLFTLICASILSLASGEPPSNSLGDLIESRAKPIYETLKAAAPADWPEVETRWFPTSHGVWRAHIVVKNGPTFIPALRVRMAGPGIIDGRVLALWSNQFWDLLPQETAECDVEFRTKDGKSPGVLNLTESSLVREGQRSFEVAAAVQ